jgi:hypothetical protein
MSGGEYRKIENQSEDCILLHHLGLSNLNFAKNLSWLNCQAFFIQPSVHLTDVRASGKSLSSNTSK